MNRLTQADPFKRHAAFRDAMRGNVPPQILELALTDTFDPTRLLALRFAGQVEFTPAQKARAMADVAPEVQAMAVVAFGHELPPEEHAKLLCNESPRVRCSAVCVRPLTAPQQIAMLADPSPEVRAQVVSLGGLTKQQLQHAMQDESRQVREAAEGQGGKKTFRGLVRDFLYRARSMA